MEALADNSALKFLSLTENELTDSSAVVIAKLVAGRPAAFHLDCDRNRGITATGYGAISKAHATDAVDAVVVGGGEMHDEL